MLSLDGAITLGGRKQPLNERRPSSAKVILFENRCGSIPRWRGGGGVNVEGGGGRLCEILAKWGVGVSPHRGVNPREYGISCGHCHTCMINCWKVISFAESCTQSGTRKVWRTDRRTDKWTDGRMDNPETWCPAGRTRWDILSASLTIKKILGWRTTKP